MEAKTQVVPISSEPGQIVPGDDGPRVNVKGGHPDVIWTAGYTPAIGDNVRVLSVDGTATVLGPVLSGPPCATGTVTVADANGKVGVLGDDGNFYTCRYVGTAPAVNTRVYLLWQGTEPLVLPGALAPIPGDPIPALPPAPAAPSQPTTGTFRMAALHAGSWRQGGSWEAGDVKQGVATSLPYRGAWFYGNQAAQLAGRHVIGIRLYLGPRLRLGSFNSGLTANVYGTSGNAPHDWTPVTGAHLVGIPAGFGGGWIEIPPGWGPQLIAGAGLGIQDNPYMGFSGAQPSGQVEIDWRL